MSGLVIIRLLTNKIKVTISQATNSKTYKQYAFYCTVVFILNYLKNILRKSSKSLLKCSKSLCVTLSDVLVQQGCSERVLDCQASASPGNHGDGSAVVSPEWFQAVSSRAAFQKKHV